MNGKIFNSRKNFEKLGLVYNASEKISVSKRNVENVNCFWFNDNESANSDKLIVYLHGGCFVLGSIQSHKALVSHISEQLSLPILFVEYSLAPEHPFPTAVNEILSVYNFLLHNDPNKDIIFIGDSAGAGLALSVLSKINKRGIKAPINMILLSPWTDLTCSNESFSINANLDPILTKKSLQDYAALYISNSNLSDANPIEIMSGQFPPTLILVGSEEILLDDSKVLHKAILKQNGKVKLSIYEKQNHVWMLEDIYSEESKNALNEIKEFISG